MQTKTYVRASLQRVWCWQKHRERSEPCVSEGDQYVQERVCEGASRDMYLHWMNHGCTDRRQQQQHRTDRKRMGKRWGSLFPYVVSSWAVLLRTQHSGEILSFILLRFITWGQILADSLKWSIADWFQNTLPFTVFSTHLKHGQILPWVETQDTLKTTVTTQNTLQMAVPLP